MDVMQDIDKIIIDSLRQIGCNVDENICKLDQFDTELVINAAVKCLNVLKPELEISPILPVNMAARLRLGVSLAEACQELGYTGSIGYQIFLYKSRNDLRKVFMFLVEKLPKGSDKTPDEPISKTAMLEKAIAESLNTSLSISWLPFYCHKQGFRNKGRPSIPYNSVNIEVPLIAKTNECKDYYENYLRSVPEQMQNKQCFLPSILSYNARALHSSSSNIINQIDWLNSRYSQKLNDSKENKPISKIYHNTSLSEQTTIEQITVPVVEQSEVLEPPTSPQPHIKEEKEELLTEKLKIECNNLRANIESQQNEIKKLNIKLSKVTAVCQKEEKLMETSTEQTRIKTRIYDLMENSTENIKKLESAIEASSSKLINLANIWEKHRVSLIKKYRHQRAEYSTKASKSQKILDEIKSLKKRKKLLMEECWSKDQLHEQLLTEVQKLPKGVSRSAYTKRITDLIANIEEQEDDISQICVEAHDLELNLCMLQERLKRTYTVVHDMISRDTKSSEAAKKAYELLTTFNKEGNELMWIVDNIGIAKRAIRDKNEEIHQELDKNVKANLERITADLEQIKRETAALTIQLQNKTT